MADVPAPDGPAPDLPVADGPGDAEPTWLERYGAGDEPRPPGRLLPLVTLLAGAVCAAVAGASLGGRGAVSGLVAALVVLAFFAAGPLPMRMTAALGDAAGIGLVLLLTNYAFRVVAALVVPAAVIAAGAADRGALGVSVIVCALVRVNTQVLLLRRVRRT